MDSDSSKTRFLTAIGHDMRQPLHALLLYLSALERRVEDGEAREVLGKADRAAQALAGMIEGLIQLARLDAGKVEPELERVSLKALFDDVIASAPHAAADATELYVHSDPVLLETIMQHLVANAAKHGGGDAHLSAEENNGAVEIKVRDNGPGIAPAIFPRLFEPLASGSPAGMGMGLVICRSIVEAHGGRLWVEPGPGAAVHFTLPRRDGPDE